MRRGALTPPHSSVIHPPLDQPRVGESPMKRRYDNQKAYAATLQVGAGICMEG